MQLLVCRLASVGDIAAGDGTTRVALPTRDVQRILFTAPLEDIQPLPSVRAGWLNLGGRRLPVYRTATLLGWAEPEPDLHSHLLLSGECLLAVHRAEALEPATPAQLRPGAALSGRLRGVSAGAWTRGQELVPLLVPALLRRRAEERSGA